jgi:hypothetical protein
LAEAVVTVVRLVHQEPQDQVLVTEGLAVPVAPAGLEAMPRLFRSLRHQAAGHRPLLSLSQILQLLQTEALAETG